MKLSKIDYKNAVNCLKRYNYNCVNILNVRADIINLSAVSIDGLPKAKYKISDSVLKSVVELQENVELQNSIKEYKAVVQALELVNQDSKYIFEELYVKCKSKWEIMHEKGLSERTYVRRKSELICAVHNELKKLA